MGYGLSPTVHYEKILGHKMSLSWFLDFDALQSSIIGPKYLSDRFDPCLYFHKELKAHQQLIYDMPTRAKRVIFFQTMVGQTILVRLLKQRFREKLPDRIKNMKVYVM